MLFTFLLLQFEAVYNTAGYIQATQNDAYFNVWADSAPADTLQTFQKPPGDFSLLNPSCLHFPALSLAIFVYGLVYDAPNGKRQTFQKPPGEAFFCSSVSCSFLCHLFLHDVSKAALQTSKEMPPGNSFYLPFPLPPCFL